MRCRLCQISFSKAARALCRGKAPRLLSVLLCAAMHFVFIGKAGAAPVAVKKSSPASVAPTLAKKLIKPLLKKSGRNDLSKDSYCNVPFLAFRGPFGPSDASVIIVLSSKPNMGCDSDQIVVVDGKKRFDLPLSLQVRSNPVEGGAVKCQHLVLQDLDADGIIEPVAVCMGYNDDTSRFENQNAAFKWQGGKFIELIHVSAQIRTLNTTESVIAKLKAIPAQAAPATQPTAASKPSR